jgi:hypothetical protein
VKTIAGLAVALSLWAPDALAISRYDTQDLACERVQALVLQEGEAILRFMSPRGPLVYDRYVAHAGYCEDGEYAQTGWVPTVDQSSCPILRCLLRTFEQP